MSGIHHRQFGFHLPKQNFREVDEKLPDLPTVRDSYAGDARLDAHHGVDLASKQGRIGQIRLTDRAALPLLLGSKFSSTRLSCDVSGIAMLDGRYSSSTSPF